MTTDLDRDRPDAERKPTTPAATKAGASPARSPKPGASSAPRTPANGRPPTTTRTALAGRLPWLLALLGLIGTLGFGLAWNGTRNDRGATATASADGESADMAAGATSFSKSLTNFDGATIDRDFDRIVAKSTGEFRSQADDFFSSKVRKQLKEAQASSRGEVRSAYVQSFDGDRGTVFVVLDQTIANNQSPKPKADTLRMELSLVRTGGVWKVGQVDVLSAPSGNPATGASGDAAAGDTAAGGTGG